MVTFGYGPENIPSGFEPGFDPRLAHYSNVTHIHGLFGSALQNTYISCLGHDDASSVSFGWANACAVLPRPVSGASRAERVLVETESDVDERKRLMANYNMLSTAKTTLAAVSTNLYTTSGIGVTLLLLGFCFAYVRKDGKMSKVSQVLLPHHFSCLPREGRRRCVPRRRCSG